jgi:UDPglucose 6-dehydrogenase
VFREEGGRTVNSIGVVGLGVVGGTIASAFESVGVRCRGYDRYLGIGSPETLAECELVFLCVPTPSGLGGEHDLTEVWSAMETVEPVLASGTIVGIKSTVPPGTCDRLALAYPRLRFASVPEFLVASRAMDSFLHPDRIIVGAHVPEVAAAVADCLRLVVPTAPVLFLTPTEAELAKLCANALLAAKVSMANELAEVCRALGVEWARVQGAVGLDRRIGPDHLTVTPERGFGGDCLPKDLDGLIAASRSAGYHAPLLEAVAEFNRQIRRVAAEPAPTGAD